MSPVDSRRKWQQAIEQSSPAAAKHSAHEDTPTDEAGGK